MRLLWRWRSIAWMMISLGVVAPWASPAQEPAASPPSAGTATSDDSPASPQLADEQQQLADKYQRLEMLMLKMAEFDAATQPQRAALLRQALTRSKDHRISQQMLELATLLRGDQLRTATDNQAVVRDQLAQLLELLLSEDRADRLKQEQDRVENYIKEVERILRQQRGVQGRTEGGDDPQRLAQDQGNIADRTDRLAREIDENERPRGTSDAAGEPSESPTPSSEPNSSDSSAPHDSAPQPGTRARVVTRDGRVVEGTVTEADDEKVVLEDEDGQRHEIKRSDIEQQESADPDRDNASSDPPSPNETPAESSAEPSPSEPSPGQPSPGQPSPGQPSPGQPSPGQPSPGQPSPGQPSPGQPSPGQPSPGQPSPPGEPSPQDSSEEPAEVFPGQRQIQQALERMRDAQQRLEEAQRDEALPAQQEARRLLEQAKAQLEEILRQMREEEIERALAQLESRFRKMLEMQIKVYEDTQQLSELTSPDRAGQIIVQSGRLNMEERRILQEADRALLLLREEGSSVAFPEAVEQVREDMETVADRLGQAKIDLLTLGLEEDIIAALEEIVEALQKAQQDAEQRRQQPRQPAEPMSPEDMPLVDAIAELKMIRTLQVRVNKRTETYANMLADPQHEVGQATDEDLIDSLDQLSLRERRIHEITRDLILEKNK